MTLDAAWRRWVDVSRSVSAVPLVLVAAEGGGIRAAYWTARALDCAIDADYDSCGFVPEGDPGDPGSIFAASGVSGGSLGLVAYDASVRGREQGNWADVRLGDDFVAATGAWMLFADLPNALIKLDFEPDRAQGCSSAHGSEPGARRHPSHRACSRRTAPTNARRCSC